MFFAILFVGYLLGLYSFVVFILLAVIYNHAITRAIDEHTAIYCLDTTCRHYRNGKCSSTILSLTNCERGGS
jgi:hypothetical protein